MRLPLILVLLPAVLSAQPDSAYLQSETDGGYVKLGQVFPFQPYVPVFTEEYHFGDRYSDHFKAWIAMLIKYPGLKVEIGVHTDCRASAEYNLKLTRR